MQGQLRQTNPLDDLVESEKEYLSDLKILLQVQKECSFLLHGQIRKRSTCAPKEEGPKKKNKLGAHTTASFPFVPPNLLLAQNSAYQQDGRRTISHQRRSMRCSGISKIFTPSIES